VLEVRKRRIESNVRKEVLLTAFNMRKRTSVGSNCAAPSSVQRIVYPRESALGGSEGEISKRDHSSGLEILDGSG